MSQEVVVEGKDLSIKERFFEESRSGAEGLGAYMS